MFAKTQLRHAYRLADQVVAVSRAQKQWLLENKLTRKNKLVGIPACRDYARFLALPPPTLDGDHIVIGAIGRLAPAKGFDVLIDALDLLPTNRFRLKIAGDGDEAENLRKQAANRNDIEFVGHIDDPSSFVQDCDIIAVPSRQEAFGLVCAEGKAAGRPVVVSAVDGLPEQAARCGEIVKPDCAVSLANAIERVSEPNTHSLLSSRARESMRDAWPNYIRQWSRLLA